MWIVAFVSMASVSAACGWAWVSVFQRSVASPGGGGSFLLMLLFAALAVLQVPAIARVLRLWRASKRLKK